jgi:hydrogenase-4 component F
MALIGLPPFGLFVSEFLLVQAALVGGRPWLAAVVLLLLLTAFVSLLAHLNRMLYGDPPEGVRIGEGREWPTVALMLPVAVLILLGVVLPGPVSTLIDRCVSNLIPR